MSVEWLGTPVPFNDTTEVRWTENILVLELRWVDEGTTELGFCKLNLEFVLEEEASLGVAPSLSFLLTLPLTFPGVQ